MSLWPPYMGNNEEGQLENELQKKKEKKWHLKIVPVPGSPLPMKS